MITNIILFIIALLGAVITYFIIPFLKTKFSQAGNENIQYWAEIAIRYAEDLLKGEGQGKYKKDIVLDFLKAKGFKGLPDEISMIIDAIVNQLNAIDWT